MTNQEQIESLQATCKEALRVLTAFAQAIPPLVNEPVFAMLEEAIKKLEPPVRGTRRVVCSAIRFTVEGNDHALTITGPRHWDSTMHDQFKYLKRSYEEGGQYVDLFDIKKRIETQGFVDQHGVFMDRIEARKVAEESGQQIFGGHWEPKSCTARTSIERQGG
jgi:hypothetical protein